MRGKRGLFCLWLVRWWFLPDLDLLLERDAAEEERLDELEEEAPQARATCTAASIDVHCMVVLLLAIV